jgi:proteasome accessory factor C
MPDTAAARLSRIVSLVAESSRRERQGEETPTVEALAAAFGVTPADIVQDLRTLTLLGDHADADWLLSLTVWQQGRRIAISSAGPFRRPIRLSPEELLALKLALISDPKGKALLDKLGPLLPANPPAPNPPALAIASPVADRQSEIREAIASHREMELLYTGEGERIGQPWLIQPHQLVSWRARTYLIAWCPALGAWRTFRLERIIDALIADRTFEPRPDFQPVSDPAQLFRRDDTALDAVRVRCVGAAARWARERYPDAQPQADGSVLVTFQASSTDWLVRRVLEFGPEAEVLEPPAYRQAMRRAVA